MVLAGAVSLACWAMMASLVDRRSAAAGWSLTLVLCVPVVAIAVWSPTLTAVLMAVVMCGFLGWRMAWRSQPRDGLWDHSLLRSHASAGWRASVALWWLVLAVILGGLYAWFW